MPVARHKIPASLDSGLRDTHTHTRENTDKRASERELITQLSLEQAPIRELTAPSREECCSSSNERKGEAKARDNLWAQLNRLLSSLLRLLFLARRLLLLSRSAAASATAKHARTSGFNLSAAAGAAAVGCTCTPGCQAACLSWLAGCGFSLGEKSITLSRRLVIAVAKMTDRPVCVCEKLCAAPAHASCSVRARACTRSAVMRLLARALPHKRNP